MRAFPQLSRDEVLYELPEAQGRAFIAWSLENEGGMVPWERDGDGYVGQHVALRLAPSTGSGRAQGRHGLKE